MRVDSPGYMCGRRYLLVTIVLFVLLGSDLPAAACRCAPRALPAYFVDADVVFVGRARSFAIEGTTRAGRFEVHGEAYKGEPSAIQRFATAVSSSECGVAVEEGRLYLVFATHDEANRQVARFDTCSGTRSFDPQGAEGVQGFTDTPAREVLRRLVELRRAAPTASAVALPTPGAMLPLHGDPHAVLIGLLELPSVLNLDEPGADSPPPRLPMPPIPVYSKPDTAAPRVATIGKPHEVITREYSYERKGAVVLERRPGWYRVELARRRSGWINESAAGTFHPLAQLLVNRLTYLTAYWDGFVWPDPGAGYPWEHPPWRTAERKEWPVEVLSTQVVGDSLWLQVRVLSKDPCEGGTPKAVLGGWVPAYTARGKLVVWFHARGC